MTFGNRWGLALCTSASSKTLAVLLTAPTDLLAASTACGELHVKK